LGQNAKQQKAASHATEKCRDRTHAG
jgi:hypothetical protein